MTKRDLSFGPLPPAITTAPPPFPPAVQQAKEPEPPLPKSAGLVIEP